MKEGLIKELEIQQTFLLNTISCLSEEDSGFKPKDKMYTVAQHIGHAAETIDWFMEGAFGNGFEMNFDNYEEKMKEKYNSFDDSVKLLKEATARGIEAIKNASDAELMAPITGEIMKGAPKLSVIGGITDHTAHHRGALAVYARLLDRVPMMPYSGM
ncbi:MAG: DinB family protein [Melioribacteraceae bacterium]|nr:DinB family protein [Melioribacteraceae bacterium]